MKEVRIGFFGLDGHQITGGIPKLQRARLAAVAGVAEDRLQKLKETFPDVSVFEDLDTMLEKGDVDLISFCTVPRTDQTKQVIRALNAGKHVLVEKPMATTMADLAEVRRAAEASGTESRTSGSSTI